MTAALLPRPHQTDALEGLRRELAVRDRAQLIMACGTGKTLVGRWLAEHQDARRVLVVVPSLILLAQTLGEWRRVPGWRFEPFVCCCDPTTADGAAERAAGEGWDPGAPFWASHRARVSTDPHVTTRYLQATSDDRPLVLFSTYHSLPVVQQAARRSGTTFDLAIFDEAHNLAGKTRAAWRGALHDKTLPIAKRVFMTATPVHFDDADRGLSMNDEETFGRVAHRLTFADAIAKKLLVDYEVLVVDTGRGHRGRLNPMLALTALGREGVGRVISFHGRVHKATSFAHAADGHELPDGRTVDARLVSALTPTSERTRHLRHLAHPREDTLALLANARCLAEGVDVPAVDAVLFADPKNSTVDLVQAIGRALRPAPGKTRGVIMVPVALDGRFDDDTSLTSGPFAGVWAVLRALRGLDERFAASVDTIRRDVARRGRATGERRPLRIRYDLPPGYELDLVNARLVDAMSSGWHHFYGLLQAYADDHGSVLTMPAMHRCADGTTLGQWADRQRTAFRRGLLTAEQTQLLGQVPGWTWDADHGIWLHQLAHVQALAERRGGLDLPGAMTEAPLPSARRRGNGQRTLGRWCAAQRIAWRTGTLAPEQQRALRQIRGWRTAAVDEQDAAMIDLLGEYAAWKHDANPPAGYVEDDLALGDWLHQLRRRRVTRGLPRALEDEIAEVTPARSEGGALRWKSAETQWLLGFEALRQFVDREHTSRVPHKHVEALPDIEIQLSVWCRRQRHLHRHGKLHPTCTAALEQVPGWLWEVPLRNGARLAIDVEHGTRTGYVRGCRCDSCTDANREKQAYREQHGTELVDARRARGWLRILMARGATQKGLARASRINVKTLLEIASGETRRILPDTERALLALTPSTVRLAAAPGTRVDAGPTWELLDDLIERGFPKSWIARELGKGQTLQLSRTTISAGNATAVAQLHQRIGELQPRRRWRAALPRLEELIAEQSERDSDEEAVS